MTSSIEKFSKNFQYSTNRLALAYCFVIITGKHLIGGQLGVLQLPVSGMSTCTLQLVSISSVIVIVIVLPLPALPFCNWKVVV
jgi:hypothetical protein